MNIRQSSRRQAAPQAIFAGVNLGEMSREELQSFVVNFKGEIPFHILDMIHKIDKIKMDQEWGTGIFDEAGQELSFDQARQEGLI